MQWCHWKENHPVSGSLASKGSSCLFSNVLTPGWTAESPSERLKELPTSLTSHGESIRGGKEVSLAQAVINESFRVPGNYAVLVLFLWRFCKPSISRFIQQLEIHSPAIFKTSILPTPHHWAPLVQTRLCAEASSSAFLHVFRAGSKTATKILRCYLPVLSVSLDKVHLGLEIRTYIKQLDGPFSFYHLSQASVPP